MKAPFDVCHCLCRHTDGRGGSGSGGGGGDAKGSCDMETCWIRLAPFREVATKLYQGLDQATRVVYDSQYPPSNRKRRLTAGSPATSGAMMPRRPRARSIGSELSIRSPNKDDLLYAESSPDFCEPNEAYNIKGTKGRICSEDKKSLDSCERLCCGRGYRTEVRDEKYSCNCVFKFCCQLSCKTRTRRKMIHKCL